MNIKKIIMSILSGALTLGLNGALVAEVIPFHSSAQTGAMTPSFVSTPSEATPTDIVTVQLSGPGLGSNSGSGGPVIGVTGYNAASKARQDDMYNKMYKKC